MRTEPRRMDEPGKAVRNVTEPGHQLPGLVALDQIVGAEEGLTAQSPHCGSHLLRSLPLGQLRQPFLARPHAGVDDLDEELARERVEDGEAPVDGLGGHVPLVCPVHHDSITVGVVHEPGLLVAE